MPAFDQPHGDRHQALAVAPAALDDDEETLVPDVLFATASAIVVAAVQDSGSGGNENYCVCLWSLASSAD